MNNLEKLKLIKDNKKREFLNKFYIFYYPCLNNNCSKKDINKILEPLFNQYNIKSISQLNYYIKKSGLPKLKYSKTIKEPIFYRIALINLVINTYVKKTINLNDMIEILKEYKFDETLIKQFTNV